MQEVYVHGYWEKFTYFIRSLFNATFKTNPYFERAIMTGITRVSKESVFSDLNNLKVVTTTSNQYATDFGFTEKEVFAAMDEMGLSDKAGVKRWYDGFIFGSPVYYSGINGNLMSFMDRVFYSASAQEPHPFRFKPAAAVVYARRAGTTSALDQMNKYFLHQQMPIVSSRYWNMVHGNTPDEVCQDEEGLQIMRYLGRNMAWMLKLIESGRQNGILPPEQEERRLATNFIK